MKINTQHWISYLAGMAECRQSPVARRAQYGMIVRKRITVHKNPNMGHPSARKNSCLARVYRPKENTAAHLPIIVAI